MGFLGSPAAPAGFLPHTHTGKSGGQVQPLAKPAKAVLHDAVLQRVEGDDAQPPARIQPGHRVLKQIRPLALSSSLTAMRMA